MARKPSYEGLQQRVKELEKEVAKRKRAEEKLHQSEEKYRLLIDNYGNPITVFDSDGILLLINIAGAKNLGGMPKDFIGKSMHELFADMADIYMERNRKIIESGIGNDFEDIFELPSGKRWFWSNLQPVKGPSGKAFAVQIISHDITDRKRAEEKLQESEEKYSTLVENSLTGIYIDQDKKIVFANKKFAEIYRYRRKELVGMQVWRLVHPEDRALTNEIRAKRLKGQDAPFEYEARGLTRDGETIWIKRRNTLIEYRGRPAILGNIVETTEQKRAEAELRKTNEELKNFVHVVSHDLKIPIISIQGLSYRLAKSYKDELGDKGRKYLEQIKASARRMEILVSDLLSLSSIGQVVSTSEDVSSFEIVRNVASGLQDILKQKEIELVVGDNLPTICCDGERIYQVFENLLANAIKFTGAAKQPKIEIRYRDRERFHEFCVKDNGIGIDQKHHRKIFEMFHRLKEMEDEEGTGLGLSIVKRIVNNHGGKIWVESEKGKGATFYFTLSKLPTSH